MFSKFILITLLLLGGTILIISFAWCLIEIVRHEDEPNPLNLIKRS
jgi:hypothetical protein